jgi:hypothetical protein
MRVCEPGMSEHALVSHFEHQTALAGSLRPAYVPVCASGEQALTIHYVENNRRCKDGEMVLLDAGCEYGGYASDITRSSCPSSPFPHTFHLDPTSLRPQLSPPCLPLSLPPRLTLRSLTQELSPSPATSPPPNPTSTKPASAS